MATNMDTLGVSNYWTVADALATKKEVLDAKRESRGGSLPRQQDRDPSQQSRAASRKARRRAGKSRTVNQDGSPTTKR